MAKKFFPWDDIPETDVFPNMNGVFNVTEMKEDESKSGKLMYVVRYRCQEPAKYAGIDHTEWYVVGTDENPEEINPATFGARDLQKLRIACNIGKEVSDAEKFVAFMNSTNPPVGLFIIQRKDADTGEIRNSVGRGGYWKVGSRKPEVIENNARQRPQASKTAPPRPTAPPQTAAPKMNRPPRPGAAGAGSIPAQPDREEPPVESYQDQGDAGEKEAPAEDKSEFKVKCDNCGEMVPPREYSKHLAECVNRNKK